MICTASPVCISCTERQEVHSLRSLQSTFQPEQEKMKGKGMKARGKMQNVLCLSLQFLLVLGCESFHKLYAS